MDVQLLRLVDNYRQSLQSNTSGPAAFLGLSNTQDKNRIKTTMQYNRFTKIMKDMKQILLKTNLMKPKSVVETIIVQSGTQGVQSV